MSAGYRAACSASLERMGGGSGTDPSCCHRQEPERIKEWENLLKQHLHVKEYNCQYDETKVSNEYYLFPYELNKANHMIFALYSDFKNDYEGGIKEVAFDIFERLNRNLVIEIVTKEEMLNHAANRVQEVYNRRIRRISEENSIIPILVLN